MNLVGMAAVAVADVTAESGDFDRVGMTAGSMLAARDVASYVSALGFRDEYDSELSSHGISFREDAHDLLGRGIRGDIVVGRLASENQIAHTAAAQVGLMASIAESA